MSETFVIGIDFGSDSARAILVDAGSGKTLGEGMCVYPRWTEGKYCDPARNQYRQHPLDYIEALETSVKGALNAAGGNAGKFVRGLSVDTTGSTPCPVSRQGIPLSLLEGFEENPNAMFHLWKDHTAILEAEEIDRVFSGWKDEDYTRFQGIYSSEWFWAKILHTIRTDPKVEKAAWSWVEHSDWMPALLTGNTDPLTMYRCSCAAGHKALWHSEFGGLPSEECLSALSPYLSLVRRHYGGPPRTADTCVGRITPEWAARLGISGETVIGGSSFDAHAGAVGSGITPRCLVKVVGTSTVDMMIEKYENMKGKVIKEICGQAENSIVPGYVGIEAGQAAFGDIYAWFRRILMWPVQALLPSLSALDGNAKKQLQDELFSKILPELERSAGFSADESDLVALDWFNGRRYPHINEHVKSAICGLHLGTTAPQLYRALALGTVFGSRRIVDGFLCAGLTIDRIITIGGIAQKSPYVMQMMADVLNRPILVSAARQACAKGASMYAAVAAGLYGSIRQAQEALGEGFLATYRPIPEHTEVYERLYRKYLALGGFADNQSAE